MIKIFIQLFNILPVFYKKKILLLQFLNILVSMFEIATLAILAIFITTISKNEIIFENQYLFIFFNFFEFSNKFDFLFIFGLVSLAFYTLTSSLNIYVTWKTNFFSQTLVQYFSTQIIKNYAFKSWLEFSKIQLSSINKDIYTDATILSNSIIIPFFNLLNKLFLTFAIALTLAIYNLKISIIGLLIYIIIYSWMLVVVKKITKKVTIDISENRSKNHHFINSFFSGFKEMIIFNLREAYFQKIKKNNEGMILPSAYLLSLTQIPRFFVELVSYVFIILSILFVIKTGKNLDILLPTIAIYAFAGLKLLPAFQQIYLAYIRIKSGKIAYKNIFPKLKKSIQIKEDFLPNIKKLEFEDKIQLKNIGFDYDDNVKKPAIYNINLSIKKNSIVGIAGLSGSGKSTIIDIISGLLIPSNGIIKIDKQKLTNKNLREWQNNFAIVTQSPFLFNDSLDENITLGFKKNKNFLKKVIKEVQLSKFVKSKKNSFNTILSDRGQNISGGERQRIAIARSLYFNSNIIIFDEATNALDLVTERKIIENIKKLKKEKTIIMISHKMNTLKFCDNIFLVKNGKIVNSGKFLKLKKSSKYFRDLIGLD